MKGKGEIIIYQGENKKNQLEVRLVKGYTLNEKRLQEQGENFQELHQTVGVNE